MNTRRTKRFTFHVSRLVNPIIIKEMRAQMRGPRAFLILTGYLLGLGLLAYGLYRITLTSISSNYGSGLQSALLGQTLFIGLAFLEMVFVCFVTPALTTGTISGESERRTSDMLLATPLRPAGIVWGKLFASLTYVQLLILAAIPLSSIVFLFGGVALRDVIQAIGLLVLTAITYGTLGSFFSALTRRTSRATVWSYLVVLAIVFSGIFYWTVTNSVGWMPAISVTAAFYMNPFSALASAVFTPQMDMYGMGPAGSLLFALSGGPNVLGFYSPEMRARPLWQYTVTLYLAATVVLYLLTTQLVKPVRRWRIGWQGWIGLLLVLALLAGGLWIVFGTTWGSTGYGGFLVPTQAPMPAIAPGGVVVQVAPPVPTPTPPPAPTPVPPPMPFDAGEHRENMESFLIRQLFPEGSTAFCDLLILGDDFDAGDTYVNVWAWGRCRAFSLEDGELSPGTLISGPFYFNLNWFPDLSWQLTGGGFVSDPSVFPSFDFYGRLLEEPYDEAAGEERLRERAQMLLGE